MRLTIVARMEACAGRLSSYSVAVSPAEGGPLPVSFDQDRLVSLGSRSGSWRAAAFCLDRPARHIAHSVLEDARRRRLAQGSGREGPGTDLLLEPTGDSADMSTTTPQETP